MRKFLCILLSCVILVCSCNMVFAVSNGEAQNDGEQSNMPTVVTYEPATETLINGIPESKLISTRAYSKPYLKTISLMSIPMSCTGRR